MDKKVILTGIMFGFISIVLGAFGAHALKKELSIDQIASFEVGVRYMMYHALFLLFIGTAQMLLPKQKNVVYYFTIFGAILFSGSIFLLTTSTITGVNFKFIGPITPIGGLLLILAWAMTFYYIFIKKV
jgi:uncharacterized membrane protein YgdD (TMEM256/DUF423 family)